MKEKDEKILILLQKNSRISLKEIAKKLGMPISTVFTKIKKFEEEGLIKKYSLELDEKKLGYTVKAFVLVTYKSNSKSQEEVAKEISKLPFVERVYIIAGQWDILVEAIGKDVEDLGKWITEKLREIEGVDKTQTLIVLKKIKESYVLSSKGVDVFN
ncbi:MAG: AsnC family transcriptional regulator [Candidatus Aenigmarchaeota archaeon ex4484_224]|nr:MAG: AsnC family transcriptional regulator [Candidatus Aenigmarchaeota archaeon ex4484_224]